jgi:predicted transcriptional regulator
MPDLSKPGYFARKYGMSVKLDPETTRVIAAHAEATHQTPAAIIAGLVREKLAM